MAESARQGRERGGNGHVVPLLSLNLILLAFFILLNALSEVRADKSRAVLDSINRTFRGELVSPEDDLAYIASLGSLPRAAALVRAVGSVFESAFPLARSSQLNRADMMRIDLPVTDLFKPGAGTLRPDRRVMVRRLARALMRDRLGVPLKYDLEFLHGVAMPDVTGAAPPDYALQVRRGRDLARHLLRQSLPPEALSVGLLPGRADIVRFVLRVRPAPRPPAGAGGAATPGDGDGIAG